MKTPRFLTLCIYALFTVCPLLFFTDLTRNPYYTQIALLNILMCVVWLLWILQAWFKGEWVWYRSPLDGIFWIFIGVCLASWASCAFQHPNFIKPIYSEGSKTFVFLIVNCYLVYAAAIRFQDRDRLRKLMCVTYAVAVAAGVYGIAQYYGSEWIWPHNLNPYGSRPVSSFGNPNFMSSYMVLVISVAIADFLFKITGMPRVLLAGVITASSGALIATLTRSSWLGAVVAVGVLGIGLAKNREAWSTIKTPALVLALGLGILVLAWPKSSTASYSQTVLGRLTEVKQIKGGTYGAITQRQLIWLCAWEMVLDHPILGKGWGCFELFYPFYQGPQLYNLNNFSYRTHANNAHDEILENWSQIGTIGLGVVICMWLLFFRSGVSISSRLTLPWKAMSWGLMGGVAGMLADNILNVSVHFAVPAFMFWWWVGSLYVLEPASIQIKTYPLQTAGRRAALAAAALGLSFLTVRAGLFWAQEVNFFEGFKLSKGGVDLMTAVRYLEKAYAFHPLDVNNNYELANVYARLGQKENALKMYQRSLDANAGYDEIYFNLATVYMQTGHEEEAVRNYNIALSINPLSRESINALSGIYLRNVAKYGDAAHTMYTRALLVYPNVKELWNDLGFLEAQRQRWPESQQAYLKALAIDPHFELARRNLMLVEPHLQKTR